MVWYVIVVDVITYLIFAEAVFLHDFTIGIVIRINLLSFTFERIDMNLGVVNASSLSDARNLVSLDKGENCLVAHLEFLLQLIYCIIVSPVKLCYKLGKVKVNKGFIKVGVPALINLWDVKFLNPGSDSFL